MCQVTPSEIVGNAGSTQQGKKVAIITLLMIPFIFSSLLCCHISGTQPVEFWDPPVDFWCQKQFYILFYR